jgi:hypothetical protein
MHGSYRRRLCVERAWRPAIGVKKYTRRVSAQFTTKGDILVPARRLAGGAGKRNEERIKKTVEGASAHLHRLGQIVATGRVPI